MLSSFRTISLAFALAGTLVLCAGCSQGAGDRCEIDSDCASGLVCKPTGSPHNGVCTPVFSSGSGGSTAQDAASPASTPDAASDGPVAAADAAASVDAPVVADGAGGDTSPDAEAAVDMSATD